MFLYKVLSCYNHHQKDRLQLQDVESRNQELGVLLWEGIIESLL